MTIVVDTSILIDHLRGDERARDLLREALSARHRLVGSVLSKVEVLGGMQSPERSATHRLLSLLEWVPVDEALWTRNVKHFPMVPDLVAPYVGHL